MTKELMVVLQLILISACGVGADTIYSNNTDEPNARNLIQPLDDDRNCPVGLVSGIPLNEEFGPGTMVLTRCLNSRRIRVVYQINNTCANPDCSKPYALGNINNAIKDYTITHGLEMREEVDVVAIVLGPGYSLVLNNNAEQAYTEENPFQQQVEDLLSQGVRIFFCQNTARSKGIKTANLIPGIRYVTSGVTAVADFQDMRYSLVVP
ncbi:MAG: DsrE family protein [Gammaproteobacteria bacterium]|nr:DsrE family protein [Gammaproteobacteria bacterium]